MRQSSVIANARIGDAYCCAQNYNRNLMERERETRTGRQPSFTQPVIIKTVINNCVDNARSRR